MKTKKSEKKTKLKKQQRKKQHRKVVTYSISTQKFNENAKKSNYVVWPASSSATLALKRENNMVNIKIV